MTLPYEAVETVDLDSLVPNNSVRIIAIMGSFKRRTYEVDVFKEAKDHVFGIAAVADNVPENEMLGGRPAVDPESVKQVYVRFPRHGELANGPVEFDELSEDVVGDRRVEEIGDSEWVRTNLGIAALGFFELPKS